MSRQGPRPLPLGAQAARLRQLWGHGVTSYKRNTVTWRGTLQPSQFSPAYQIRLRYREGNRPDVSVLQMHCNQRKAGCPTSTPSPAISACHSGTNGTLPCTSPRRRCRGPRSGFSSSSCGWRPTSGSAAVSSMASRGASGTSASRCSLDLRIGAVPSSRVDSNKRTQHPPPHPRPHGITGDRD